jgi:hypothetical protein
VWTKLQEFPLAPNVAALTWDPRGEKLLVGGDKIFMWCNRSLADVANDDSVGILGIDMDVVRAL